MGVITDAFVTALKKIKDDEGILSDAELTQLTTMVDIKAEEHVKTATAGLQAEIDANTAKIDSNTADLQKINDVLVDSTLTADQTTAAIGEVLGVAPVNAEPVPEPQPIAAETTSGDTVADTVAGADAS